MRLGARVFAWRRPGADMARVFLDLNLAQEGARPIGWRRAAAWAAASCLVAAATTAHALYYRSLVRSTRPAEARLRTLEREARRLQGQHTTGIPAKTREALAALPARVEAYNRILVAAAFPWTGLLVELEAALPPNVALTTIQPDPATGAVALQGLARSFADVTAFIGLLEQRDAFHDVQLLRNSEQGPGVGEAIRLQEFTLRLQYGPEEAPGPEGRP